MNAQLFAMVRIIFIPALVSEYRDMGFPANKAGRLASIMSIRILKDESKHTPEIKRMIRNIQSVMDKKRNKQRPRIKAASPLLDSDFQDLISEVGQMEHCDHTHKRTIAFLQSRRLPVKETVEWLKEHGGYCDCEVLMNVTAEPHEENKG